MNVANLHFESPIEIINSGKEKKIKGVLFKVGKVSGNNLQVLGMTEEAKKEIINSVDPFDIEHAGSVVGKVNKITFDDSNFSFGYEGTLNSPKAIEMINSGSIQGGSWTGRAKSGKEWVTDSMYAEATAKDPLPVVIQTLRKIGLVMNPAHPEASLELTNSLKSQNTPEEIEDMSEKPQDESTTKKAQINKYDGAGEVSPTELRNFMKNFQSAGGQSFHVPKNKQESYYNNFAKEITNAVTSSTTGQQIKIAMPYFQDFVSENNFLADFCNFNTDKNDVTISSISNNQLAAEQTLAEQGLGTASDNTYNGVRLAPRARIFIQHEVSNTAIKLGNISQEEIAILMTKNFMRKATKKALFGDNVVSPIIKGIANDASITAVAANATWAVGDFQKQRKNRPYAKDFINVIGFSDWSKFIDYQVSLGKGFTDIDKGFMMAQNFDAGKDYMVIGNSAFQPLVVLQDDVIPPVSNLQTRFHGNFAALGVQMLGMPELIVDNYTKAASNTTIFTLQCELDSQVTNVQQLGYMTGVNVA
jgi:hypothetical protein